MNDLTPPDTRLALAATIQFPEQTPLSDPLRLWLRFARLQARMEVSVMQRLRAIGLSIPQFDLLSTLTESEGMTQKELASRLYVTKGNVSGLVDRLTVLGLVERLPVEGDKRSHTLILTQKGRELAQTGIAILRAYVGETIGLMREADRIELDRLLSIWRDQVRDAERSR